MIDTSVQTNVRSQPILPLTTRLGPVHLAVTERAKALAIWQDVVGLDNFSTGYPDNLNEVKNLLDASQWAQFRFIEGDIRDLAVCARATREVDHVLHQAALGSVPRSIVDPITSNAVNVGGFVNMLVAARDAGVASFTYAASSSTYGDHPALPKVEDRIGRPLSPYAVTKYVNELYADVFSRCYGIRATGLRYFNVFGRRQDPDGAYAALIPKWIAAMVNGDEVAVNGDGSTSRDFCYVDNVVQANLLAALAPEEARGQVYNVAVGDSTTLLQLFEQLREVLMDQGVTYHRAPLHRPPPFVRSRVRTLRETRDVVPVNGAAPGSVTSAYPVAQRMRPQFASFP